MKKLKWYLTGIMFLFSFITYITLAIWVVQDGFAEMHTRIMTAFVGVCWLTVTAFIIFIEDLPGKLAQALVEDCDD